MTRATIQGVTFEGGEGDKGFFLDLDNGFIGWDDAPDMRRDSIDLVTAHGAFDVPGYLDARVVTFAGMCHSSSPEEQQWFRNRLMGVAADGDKTRLVVEHQGDTLWAEVRRNSAPQFRSVVFGQLAQYQIEFWAANPRKFGKVNTFEASANTSVYVSHYGNFQASPSVVVSGYAPTGTYAVEAFGRRFHVSKPLLPEHPHTLNFTGGQLIVDGSVQVGGIIEADAWTIPPGASVGHYLNMPSGVGQMRIEVLDTFI